MPDRRFLLLSNSRNYGQGYLEHAEAEIKTFLGDRVRKVLFIPFAAVRFTFDQFAKSVGQRFSDFGYELDSVHASADARQAVADAEAIVVGGGNTFHLLHRLYERELLEAIGARVRAGVPYIGWSAGSNVACPTIKTTNDMPIIQPPSFAALGLVPFQINPHYLDAHPEGHQGETREERLLEFVEVNPAVTVVGLREGSMLRVEGATIRLIGDRPVRIFMHGKEPQEYDPQASLQFLL
ncbi:MAG TPA: dipeptidase PepE [Blastocatellia bacterium]|nr:dipeptidase PepE [Blastocatellia bacterium]